MKYRFSPVLPILFFTVILFFGCSPGFTPISPDNKSDLKSSANITGSPVGTRNLFGYWQCEINPDNDHAEIIPLRETCMHANVVKFLQSPMPNSLAIKVNGIKPKEGRIDLDLTIAHPFPGTDFRGFDVRGIIMGSGKTIAGKLEPEITFFDSDGTRLENADGYTRWWNAPEFTTAGLFGFTSGALGTKTFTPNARLNPYKYFADVLSPTDPVTPLVNTDNRGTFSTDQTPPSNTRNYKIKFPMSGGGTPIWSFQYAIDACWAKPIGSTPPPKPIGDYLPQANCPEAYNISVDTEGSTAYYVDETNYGGGLVLAIEVFDWGAPSNFNGINGEIESIWVESPTLFDSPVSVYLSPKPGSLNTSGIYTLTIPNVHPDSVENQEVLVTVRSWNPTTYAPPAPGPAYPLSAKLAAYALVTIPVSDTAPPANQITVTKPNGGEVWVAGTSEEITWLSDGDTGANVKIEFTISDMFPQEIISSTPNDGSFTWDPIPDINYDKVKVRITSIEKPSISDDSDDYFMILPPGGASLTITIPNGGEIWAAAGSEEITWESVGPIGDNVKLEYSITDGTPQTIIDSTPNTGSYVWNPIADIESEEVRVIVTSIDNSTFTDQSDGYFKITSGPILWIKVTAPNGGEIWDAGGMGEITWTWKGDIGPKVRLDYSIDDGSPINIVSQTSNDGDYFWSPLPNIDSDKVKIIITSFLNPLILDKSDGFFSIVK